MTVVYEEEVRRLLEGVSIKRAMIIDEVEHEDLRCPWCDYKIAPKDKKCWNCGGKL